MFKIKSPSSAQAHLEGGKLLHCDLEGAGVQVTCVASRMKSWMMICSSLERHSLSLLIRVTVKASQFMDSSRLGQYTNSSSAFGKQGRKKLPWQSPGRVDLNFRMISAICHFCDPQFVFYIGLIELYPYPMGNLMVIVFC